MSKNTAIELILIPSAPSEWDEEGRLQGRSDLPMSAAGVESLDALVTSLASDSVQQVLTAPDEASVGTARRIAKAVKSKAKQIDALADVALGLWEGLQQAQANERYPKVYRQWRADPLSVVPPEAEPFEEAAQRVLTALSKALVKAIKSEKNRVAVVLRPTALAIVLSWIRQEPIGEHWPPQADQRPQRATLARDRLGEAPALQIAARAS